MAAVTTTSVAEILRISYSTDEYIVPHERFMCPIYDAMEEFEPGDTPVGAQHIFEIESQDSHSAAGLGEATDWPTYRVPASIQASITAKQMANVIAFSSFMLEVSKRGGTIHTKNIVQRYAEMCVRNYMTAVNRWIGGHGSGRLGTVEASTVTATTFIAGLPESTFRYRRGMYVGFYDLDTGGTLQGTVQQVLDFDDETRVVTLAAAVTLTANWVVVRMKSDTVSEYGFASMGVRGIADTGGLQATLYTKARANFPVLVAKVIQPSTSGGRISYSESLLRRAINSVRRVNDAEPTHIICNQGIVSEHYNFLTPNRLYMQSGPGVPAFQIGQNEDQLKFLQNGKEIKFLIDRDYPCQEFLVWTNQYARRHILRKPAWMEDDESPEGSSRPVLLQAPGGTNNYNMSKVGGMWGAFEIAHLLPAATCRVTGVADAELGGDTQ